MTRKLDRSWKEKGPGKYPVSVGYHSLWLTPKQSVRIGGHGEIIIISARGKEINTGLNVKSTPNMYSGGALPGDVRAMSGNQAEPYKTEQGPTPPKPVREMFTSWKAILGTNEFKKGRVVGSAQLYEYRLTYSKMTLVAASSHPTRLLYIEFDGETYYEGRSANPDVPITSAYVHDVQKQQKQYFMTRAEKEKKVLLETAPVEPDWREKSWGSLLRWQRKVLEEELTPVELEAKKQKGKKITPVSNKDSVLIMMTGSTTDAPYEKPLTREEATSKAKEYLKKHPEVLEKFRVKVTS